ncbi:E3 ubiquitin-protein ligase SINA [Trifolium repens]|nr:E3 ubiquitin-protein ligase SINA [Trifolium repens]
MKNASMCHVIALFQVVTLLLHLKCYPTMSAVSMMMRILDSSLRMETPSMSPSSLMTKSLFFKRKMMENCIFLLLIVMLWEMQSILAALVLILLSQGIIMIYWPSPK